MPDTGAPWNIPYVAGTDLVSDWPTDSQALANAIASGLDAAGGLVAVKSAIFTGTQTNSTAASGSFDITDLSITHTLSDATNKLIISGTIGTIASGDNFGRGGIAAAVDGTLINIGDAASNRTRTTAGGPPAPSTNARIVTSLAFCHVYAPGDTSSHTYTLRAMNLSSGTDTIYVNRQNGDVDDGAAPRGISSLVIQEVKA